MYILFAISLLCLFVLTVTAIAVTRRVRSCKKTDHPQHDFAEYLFAAAKDQRLHRDSLTPRIFPQQNVKDLAAGKTWTSVLEPIQANTRNQSISSQRF
ncbi:MAG: hypothetical protein ABI286_04545 [Edaphobacter sp.]